MGVALYELSDEFNSIMYVLENDEDFIAESLTEQLENVNEDFNTKAMNIAIMVNTLDEECHTIKSEIERLKKRQQSRENSINRMKEYLKDNMIFCGKNKISSPTHTISIRSNKKTDVSDEFIEWAKTHDKQNLYTEKTTYSPDKKLIKEAIETGALRDCPYAKITETQSVVIK